MNDTIYRQDAIDAFEDTTFTKNEIRRRLSELPSAQVEPKVGKWVLAHQGTIAEWWYCSVCGKHGYKTTFCPECGSKNTNLNGTLTET